MKILFVDDEDIILKLGDLFIKSLGHQVILANSGKKAISILSDNNCGTDLVFLDLMMPITSGFDVLKFMAERSIEIPTVVQTGILDQRDLNKALKLGAKEYINKPYTKTLIKNIIDKYSSHQS